jgi:hypothetical protein
VRVRAVVDGFVRFPDRPEHQGHLGLVGGEDVKAERASFRSTTEAARWAESVLDGTVRPRWKPHGPVVGAHTPPEWQSARIVAEDEHGNTLRSWTLRGGQWQEGG